MITKYRPEAAVKAVAVALAAGSSQRMKGFDKVFAGLGGKPVLVHSLLTFMRVPEIAGTLIVTSAGNVDKVVDICNQHSISRVLGVIAGGAERNDSARIGLEELKRLGFAESTVLIHDAARPLVSPDIVTNIINAVQTADGAIPAVPVNDTIKRVDSDGLIEKTIARNGLRAVQTPQGFKLDYILKLHRDAAENDASVTDDAMLVELAGGRVIAVPGNHTNMKITRPIDLEVAELFLNRGEH